MPVETAADLAGMFLEDEFAEPALYVPPAGASLPCSVIVDRGQGRGRFTAGRTDGVGTERKLVAQHAQLPSVVRDGLFVMLDPGGAPTGEEFKVSGAPILDQAGALWSCDLVIVD